jgi:hypothetical protein
VYIPVVKKMREKKVHLLDERTAVVKEKQKKPNERVLKSNATKGMKHRFLFAIS